MYTTFYGLQCKPFQVLPDPAFLYRSETHTMALTMLRYGVLSSSPLSVVTGDTGTGKTTLLRQLLRDLPDDHVAGLVSNFQPGRGDLLDWILLAFDQPHDGSPIARFQRFQQFIGNCTATGQSIVLMIDEAQNLDAPHLEELRMLLNLNREQEPDLKLILVGQSEFREMLDGPALRHLSQRITSDYHIQALGAEDVQPYIRHRLSVAGVREEIFPSAVCALIHRATGGIPRLINVLCELCLTSGCSAERTEIDEATLRDLTSGMERNGVFNQFASLSGPPRLLRRPASTTRTTGPNQHREAASAPFEDGANRVRTLSQT
ncbi:MAG: AAA family ATPase [Pseudomonadota bacterium]